MDFVAGEVLAIYKPYTWTSFQIVNKVRYHLSRKLGVKRFISMLETDYKNGNITDDQYTYFKYELEIDNLDYQYGLYTAYLIMK